MSDGRWKDESSWRTVSRPLNWKQLRRACLERDGYRCMWITDGARCTERATDADHIGAADDDRLENLRALCGPHHRWRTAQQGGQAAAEARRRKPRRRPDEPHPGRRRNPA